MRALFTDLYQINMMYGYWKAGLLHQQAVYELFFRKLPFGNGFAVFAGLERAVDYLNNLAFAEEDLEYLAEQGFEADFLEELRQYRFQGDLYSVREGEVVFPNEPLMRIEARVFDILIETPLLTFVNFQTLIATKAARIKQVAPEDMLMEFGARRAQEVDAAMWGTRAAYLAGFHGTSIVEAGRRFNIPIKGTMAHSWIQVFPSELEAFRAFAAYHPDNVTLLVDTYDTLGSGIPNAIIVAKEMEARGQRMQGVRLDSGDLAFLSKEARKMFDQAGLPYIKIVASNDLDENTIVELKAQGARIDGWGIGTKLITGYDQPALGGVYKVVAKEEGGELVPTIKISGNPEKVTTPGRKSVYRIINRGTGKAEADYLAFVDERVADVERLKLFDPIHTWLHKFVVDFTAKELLVPVFLGGKQVYELPDLPEIRSYHQEQLELFWPEYLRKLNPEIYPVDLSEAVWQTRMDLLQKHTPTF